MHTGFTLLRMRIIRRYLAALLLVWLVAPFLAACGGTLEVGIRRTATTGGSGTTQEAKGPTPTPATPLPGLVYRTDEGFWKTGPGGQPVRIFDRGDGLISPDGAYALYLEMGADDLDLWLADLTTGEQRNLTETPDRAETNFRWWAARPDVVLFSSRPYEISPGPGVTGFLAVVGLDGSGYRVLDDGNHTGGPPAPSPDGQTIAYGSGSTGWLYRWGAGPEVFDPADYGLSGYWDTNIGSPAWSPDGTRLAWIVSGVFAADESLQMGVAVFDLEARTAQVLHLHEPVFGDGWPPAPVWSPDGKWLAFTAWAQDPDEAGVWVVRADGHQEEEQYLFSEYHLGGDHPVWSPDGSWLAFNRVLPGEETSAWVAQVGTWGLIRLDLDLPSGAYIADWVSPAAENAPSVTPGAPAITSPPGWNTYSNSVLGVSFQYPAHWQPEGDDRYAGEDGFFSVGAVGSPGASIDDVAASEAGHVLLPYGSQPIIENLRIQGQEARLILPSADANMGDQAALIVRYPQPVELGEAPPFFVLYADQDHIRLIAQTLRFSADPAPAGTAAPTQPIAWENLPPGLVYSTYDGLWLINRDEESVQVNNNPQAVLSSDGTRLLSYDALQQDVWLINLAEGAMWNLTRTPDRLECCFRWWPERPDVVLFYSAEEGAEPSPNVAYHLSAINVDGHGYRVLDTEHDTGTNSGPGKFAPSPDGQTIAYGSGSTGWLYHWETGVQAFDPAAYGLTGYGEVQVGQPAWSPDGTRLAWIVKGGVAADGSSSWIGVGLFDLQTRTAQVLHPYESQGVGWPSAPVWSPDGRWLAFGDSSPSDNAGLWIARVGGQGEERRLGLGSSPVWSPDGKWLAFQGFPQDGPSAYLLAEVGTWKQRTLDIPPDRYGRLVDWINL